MKPFDERLFTLKLHEPSKRMQLQTTARLRQVDSEQRAIGQARGTGWLVKRVDAAIGAFREFVPEIDKACRETWLSDDDSITPEFIRGVLVPHVFTIMTARKGSIHGDLELLARRVGIGTELTPALHHLVHEANRLQSDLAIHYEIEAIELAKHAVRKIPATSANSAVLAVHSQSELGNKSEEMDRPSVNAEAWRVFREEFQALAGEEQGRAAAITEEKSLRRMDQVLRASCNYKEHPEGWERGKPEQGLICLLDTPPYGVWNYNDGVSENFRERGRLCIARSGVALGCPIGTDPEDFWLHQLYLDLIKNNSDLLFASSEKGGMILSVCVASATFCSRLEKSALEVPATNSRDQKGNRNALLFIESAGAQSSSRDTLRPAMSRPRIRTKTLQNYLNKIDGRLLFLTSKFPDWKAWGSGYGPGNQTPEFYTEIRRLKEERDCTLLELSKRLKSKALSESVEPKERRAKQKNAAIGGRSSSPKSSVRAGGQKGDPSLLDRKDRVTFRTAEEYLGVTERQRQNLIKRGSLTVEGQGHNRKITTESLRKYLPPENPK